jgi:hypothetical protein
MKRTLTAVILALGMLAMLGVPAANAGFWNRKTLVSFNEPVKVENFVLQPGQYIFKLIDSDTDRVEVAIFNGDETRLIAMVQGRQASRPALGDVQVSFYEGTARETPAVHDWFFLGEQNGVEFSAPNVLH